MIDDCRTQLMDVVDDIWITVTAKKFVHSKAHMLTHRFLQVMPRSMTITHRETRDEIANVNFINLKFHGDRPRETPPPVELNTRAVAKYSDFGHTDGYISETVQ